MKWRREQDPLVSIAQRQRNERWRSASWLRRIGRLFAGFVAESAIGIGIIAGLAAWLAFQILVGMHATIALLIGLGVAVGIATALTYAFRFIEERL